MLAVCIIKCTVLDESADCQSLTMQPPVSVTPPSSLNLYFSRVEEVKKRGEEEESSGFGCFSHLKYIDKKKKNLTRQERLTWEITQDVSISRYSRLFITGTAVTQAAARLTITLVTRLRILLTTGIVLGFTQPWSVHRAAVTRKVKVAERETNQRTPNAKAVCPKLVLCKCSLNSAPLCDCHSSVQKVYA